MKKRSLAWLLGACAGAAVSSSAMGQYQIVSNVPGTYLDITATGAYYNLGDDGTTDITSSIGNGLFPAGPVRISNNGAVAWGNTGFIPFTNAAIPSAGLAGGGMAIAPYWDDLYTWPNVPGQGVYVQESSGTLYITWNVGHILVTDSSGIVQLQVPSSGPALAQFIYQNVSSYGTNQNNGASATVGFQTSASAGVQYSFNAAGAVQNGMVLSIVPISNDPGACCLTNGTCTFVSLLSCMGSGGSFTTIGTPCVSANCPQPGACCMPDGTCALIPPSVCRTQGGIFRGPGVACGTCPTAYPYSGGSVPIPDSGVANQCTTAVYAEIVVPSTFTIADAHAAFHVTHTYQGDLEITLEHVDTATSVIMVDRPNYPATGAGLANDNFGASSAQLFMSSDTGAQIYDVPPLAAGINNVTGTWDPENPLSAFNGQPAGGTWRLSVRDCYPQDVGNIQNFTLMLGGGTGCYANCDNSTQAPVLNVQDFTCFLQRYAAGDSYANCDNSTQAPTLNVQDFTCFLQRYAAGCP
jgi:subtilisin-like proprotein convertase family protein